MEKQFVKQFVKCGFITKDNNDEANTTDLRILSFFPEEISKLSKCPSLQ